MKETIGCIKDGKWYRGPDEVVRRVDQDELKKAFSFFGSLSAKSLEVPLGSVCAVVENGVVVDILIDGFIRNQINIVNLNISESNSSLNGVFKVLIA